MKISRVESERGWGDALDGDMEREVSVVDEEIVQEDRDLCGLKGGRGRVDAGGVSIWESKEKVVCVMRGCGRVVLFNGGIEAYDGGEGGIEDFEEASALVREVGF